MWRWQEEVCDAILDHTDIATLAVWLATAIQREITQENRRHIVAKSAPLSRCLHWLFGILSVNSSRIETCPSGGNGFKIDKDAGFPVFACWAWKSHFEARPPWNPSISSRVKIFCWKSVVIMVHDGSLETRVSLVTSECVKWPSPSALPYSTRLYLQDIQVLFAVWPTI